MSSVLHPVGPEPKPTYWARRILVVAAVVVVLAVVIALITSVSGSSTVQANPSVPASAPPVVATPSGAASATASVVSSPAPVASTSAKASAGPSVSAQASGTPSVSAKPKGPVACAPADLRTTLRGKQSLKAKQADTFSLSVINGGTEPCELALTGDVVELTIYSGTDRIWSTDDCSTAVQKHTRTLAPQQALEWTQVWDGRRSKPGCGHRPETPRAGTYVATAQLKGAKPVQLRVVLRG